MNIRWWRPAHSLGCGVVMLFAGVALVAYRDIIWITALPSPGVRSGVSAAVHPSVSRVLEGHQTKVETADVGSTLTKPQPEKVKPATNSPTFKEEASKDESNPQRVADPEPKQTPQPPEPERVEKVVKENPEQKVRPADVVRKELKTDPGPFLGTGYIPEFFLGLSLDEAQLRFHNLVTNVTYNCTSIERFGVESDGGYEMCTEDKLKPKQNDCLVYSFGINNRWSYDDGISERLGCTVHSFDPSMGKPDHMHSEKVHFHNLGVWGSNMTNDAGWKMRDLKSIMGILGHSKSKLDQLKFDVEGAEWPLIEHLVHSGVHGRVRQLAMELHTPRRKGPGSSAMNLGDYGESYQAIRQLESVGFRTYFYRHRNGCCGSFHLLTAGKVTGVRRDLCCYEVFMVNTHLL